MSKKRPLALAPAKKTAAAKPEATAAEAKPKQGKAKPAAKKAFPKKAGADGKPGIIASIIEFLQAGTAKQPVTKKELLAKLAKRFPDREEKAMKQTINCQVPARLKSDKELDVQKNDNGYWLKA